MRIEGFYRSSECKRVRLTHVVQNLDHLLRPHRILHRQAALAENHLQRIRHLVEGGCRAALLSEPYQAEVGVSAVLQHGEELHGEFDGAEAKDLTRQC